RFTWTAPGRLSIEGPTVNLTDMAKSGGVLVLDWRVDKRGGLPARISLGGGTLDLSGIVRTAPKGAFETQIPLRCFVRAGANLAEVGGALRIEASAGLAVTIRGTKVAKAKGKRALACPAAVKR
ncbi:MAG: 1,4-beta-D-glucan glucohydrolase, partial [Novosphingobium sp.]|nr:1,4-beta-D-glucan glucohydrolase [Novosphingobium sp.]